MHTDNTEIPVVSFAPFLSGSRQDQYSVAEQVYNAFSTVGFVYLKDHGIPQTEVDAIFRESAKFFALPQDEKLRYALSDAAVNQGYSGPGVEGINEHKESYEHRRYNNPHCPNDTELTDFRKNVDHFYSQCFILALNVLKCLAIVMKLGDSFFEKITTKADPQLRLLHYPSIKRSELEAEGHSRIAAHTDFGLCTLLFQDSIGGLEIDPHKTGKFISAPPIPGTCLINIGDLMHRFTNGRAQSTLHRVISPALGRTSNGDELLPSRYSIPFFVHPNPDTMIDPILLDANEVKRFKPISAGAWRDYNTRRNYGLDGTEKTGLGRLESEEAAIEV